MRFNENDTVRLNFFFRVTSIRGCPIFRAAPLSRVAALASFVKTCEFLPRNYVTRILDEQSSEGKHIYFSLSLSLLVEDATTFMRVLFSYDTSYLHQTTGIFLFSPLCSAKRFSTVERAGKFRARCFVCISPSFTGFFLLANDRDEGLSHSFSNSNL